MIKAIPTAVLAAGQRLDFLADAELAFQQMCETGEGYTRATCIATSWRLPTVKRPKGRYRDRGANNVRRVRRSRPRANYGDAKLSERRQTYLGC